MGGDRGVAVGRLAGFEAQGLFSLQRVSPSRLFCHHPYSTTLAPRGRKPRKGPVSELLFLLLCFFHSQVG
jgi:hypothetical protein